MLKVFSKEGLTKHELWWFLGRIEALCLTVLYAWQDLMKLKEDAIHKNLTQLEQKEYACRIWSCISVILTTTANISKIIYGGGQLRIKDFGKKLNRWFPGQSKEEINKLYIKLYRDKGPSRRKILRKIFSQIISNSGIKFRNRPERDFLEHFDTSLQLYLIKEGPKGVIHWSFGSFTEDQLRKKNELEKCLAYFSCSENKLILLGQGSPMEPVIELIKKLGESAKVEREKLEEEMGCGKKGQGTV